MTAMLKMRMLLIAAPLATACVGQYDPADFEEKEVELDEALKGREDAGATGVQDSGQLQLDSGTADTGASTGSTDAGTDAVSVDAGTNDDEDADTSQGEDAGTNSDAGSSDAGGELTCDQLTYESYGQQFMTDNCVVCHRTGVTMGGLSLDNLEDIEFFSDEIKRRVESRSMPKGGKTLSDEEIAKLVQWMECGPN